MLKPADYDNVFWLPKLALLIRSYHDILQFLPISWQDLTKISMEGRPGESIKVRCRILLKPFFGSMTLILNYRICTSRCKRNIRTWLLHPRGQIKEVMESNFKKEKGTKIPVVLSLDKARYLN